MTLQHFRCRGLLLQRFGKLARALLLGSSNSRTFSMAITAWSAKVVDQFDLLFGERPDFGAVSDKTPMDPFAEHRHAEDCTVVAADFCACAEGVFRISLHVREYEPPSALSNARPDTEPVRLDRNIPRRNP